MIWQLLLKSAVTDHNGWEETAGACGEFPWLSGYVLFILWVIIMFQLDMNYFVFSFVVNHKLTCYYVKCLKKDKRDVIENTQLSLARNKFIWDTFSDVTLLDISFRSWKWIDLSRVLPELFVTVRDIHIANIDLYGSELWKHVSLCFSL